MSDTISTTAEVRTGLYIGGEERQTTATLDIPDPGKPGVIVGHAAAATPQDVDDAIAAAKAAFPAWSALSAAERAEQMRAALVGIAEERDADAAILSQENGKIRFEAWIDSLVFEIRWNLALMLADEVETGKTLPVVPGIPVETDGLVPAPRRRHRDRAVQLADRDPRGVPPARPPGRQHRDRQAAALGAARDGPRRPAHRREAPARRAQRRHGQGRRHGGPHLQTTTSRRSASRAAWAAASASWRWPRSR